jgi:hypothetical protein
MKKEEQKQHLIDMMKDDENLGLYKEEKQETTLEEKAEEYEYTDGIYGFKAGAKWQAKRMYTEEEVKQIIEATLIEHSDFVLADIPKWFEQFKKK